MHLKALNRIAVKLTKGNTMIKRQSAQVESSDYENMKPGEYDARLVYVADLGMQERSFQGEDKPPAQQLALGVEIMGETTTVDGIEQPRLLWVKPFNIFYKMSDKGKELQYYKVFNTSAQADTVADWDAVLGNPCAVTIANVTAKDGKVYDEVANLAAIPLKYQGNVPASSYTDACTGDSEDESNAAQVAMYGLSKYVHAKRLLGDPVSPARADDPEDEPQAFDDDIPF